MNITPELEIEMAQDQLEIAIAALADTKPGAKTLQDRQAEVSACLHALQATVRNTTHDDPKAWAKAQAEKTGLITRAFADGIEARTAGETKLRPATALEIAVHFLLS